MDDQTPRLYLDNSPIMHELRVKIYQKRNLKQVPQAPMSVIYITCEQFEEVLRIIPPTERYDMMTKGPEPTRLMFMGYILEPY